MAVALAVEHNTRAWQLRPYAVICDRGDSAAVALLHLPHPPKLGLRFSAFGVEWEIVRAGDHTRGPVARPICR